MEYDRSAVLRVFTVQNRDKKGRTLLTPYLYYYIICFNSRSTILHFRQKYKGPRLGSIILQLSAQPLHLTHNWHPSEPLCILVQTHLNIYTNRHIHMLPPLTLHLIYVRSLSCACCLTYKHRRTTARDLQADNYNCEILLLWKMAVICYWNKNISSHFQVIIL